MTRRCTGAWISPSALTHDGGRVRALSDTSDRHQKAGEEFVGIAFGFCFRVSMARSLSS